MTVNSYYSLKLTKADIKKNVHRHLVGGLWEEIGELTFRFLLEYASLRPDMKLLDLGCGCFRCGLGLIEFLDTANYYGIDVNEDLIKAGLFELKKHGLERKVPKTNIHITEDFDAETFRVKFDIILAQSLWTHLPLDQIQESLCQISKVLSADGSCFTTFFLCPQGHDLHRPYRNEPGGIVTNRDGDPYHYRVEEFSNFIKKFKLPLHLDFIGDWGHPRNQKMICIRRKNTSL